MAIQNLLNPIDEDTQWTIVRPTSPDTESDEIILTPASSPGSTCSFKTEATTWTSPSDDGALWVEGTSGTEAARSLPAAQQDRLMICIAGRDTLSASSQGPGLSKGPSIDRSLQQPPRKSQPKTKKGRGRRRRFLDRADTGKRDRREYREPYSEEQAMWLWFFRIDVRMPWKKVIAKYTIDWPLDQRKLTGTQCKFYRLATQYGFPKSRQRKGSPEEVAHRWDTCYKAMWEAALTMDQHNIIDRSTASRFVSTAGSHEARLA